jgi:integrase/recombinase XerD
MNASFQLPRVFRSASGRGIPMQLTLAIAQFLSGYFSTHHRSNKTRVAYCSDLEQFNLYTGKDFALAALNALLIEEWAAHLRAKGYSPASMRRKIVVLKVFCSYWVRRGELSESPFWRVKLSFGRIEHLPRALTETEMRTLLTHAGQNHLAVNVPRKGAALAKGRTANASSRGYRAVRNLALIDLMFATGMRVGEVSALEIDDFVVEELVFRVHGKGGRYRLAFVVDEQTVQIQHEYLDARLQVVTQSTALFLNASGQRLSTQGIANIISKSREDAGMTRHVTPHMLRHTVATLLLRNGADIRIVQEFLGHASIATTQRYTHVAKEHLIGVLRERHPSLRLRKQA